MAAENLTVICDKLDPASRDSISKLGKLDGRLHISEETVCVAAAARTCLRQTSKTSVLKLVHQYGYLPPTWEQTAPDIQLASVTVSVTAVMLTVDFFLSL